MFVRAAPDEAVIWTQPKDIEFDADQPFQGIPPLDTEFAVAMNDGSCQFLTRSIGKDRMRALATRAGGEVISW